MHPTQLLYHYSLFEVPFTLMWEKSTPEEYDDQDILKIELTTEAPPWDPSSPDFSRQVQVFLTFWEVLFSLQGDNHPWILSHYAYDAANVMDNDSFATMLEWFVIIS